MKDHFEIVITSELKEKYKRLDALLTNELNSYSRNFLKNLFLEGFVDADTQLSLSKVPAIGTVIEVTIPFPEDASLEPEDIPLEVLYEDEFLIVFNKPAGLVVHPAPGNPNGTLVNALLHHCKDLQGIGNVKRPGIVHRLDKGTSGVMVAAKEQKTHEDLVNLFSRHEITRKYVALAMNGQQLIQGKLESLIARHPNNRKKMTSKVRTGKKAITHYKVLDKFNGVNLLELTLETGRTHQIRVHLSELLHAPIINDSTYGRTSQHFQKIPLLKAALGDYEYPLLHAKQLGFRHPRSKKELFFEQEPPEIFQNCLKHLKSAL